MCSEDGNVLIFLSNLTQISVVDTFDFFQHSKKRKESKHHMLLLSQKDEDHLQLSLLLPPHQIILVTACRLPHPIMLILLLHFKPIMLLENHPHKICLMPLVRKFHLIWIPKCQRMEQKPGIYHPCIVQWTHQHNTRGRRSSSQEKKFVALE